MPRSGLEAVDGVEQADGARLLEVVDRLAAPGEAARDVLDHRQVAGDQLVAQRRPGPGGPAGSAANSTNSGARWA